MIYFAVHAGSLKASGAKGSRMASTATQGWRGLLRWMEMFMSLFPGMAARERRGCSFLSSRHILICAILSFSLRHRDDSVPDQRWIWLFIPSSCLWQWSIAMTEKDKKPVAKTATCCSETWVSSIVFGEFFFYYLVYCLLEPLYVRRIQEVLCFIPHNKNYSVASCFVPCFELCDLHCLELDINLAIHRSAFALTDLMLR